MTTFKSAVAFSMFVMLAACGTAPASEDGTTEEAASIGTLEFALTALDGQQRQYRLRDATFSIDGYSYDTGEYVSLTLSSETEPDATLLETPLLAGSYTVALNPGWYFERLTETGYERVAEATLLGASSQYVYISANETSSVLFPFGVDGSTLDFFGGDLEIGITVQTPDASDAGE